MPDRLGLAVIPGTGWRATEIQAVAREAEEAGFDAIFAAEVDTDVMATGQLMGAATRRLQVGTSITLRRYVTAVRGWLKGEGPPTHLPQRPSAERVPIYVAAVTSRTVELACELGDGLMPFLWSAERVKQSRSWIERGRANARDLGRVDVTLGLPTFIGDDLGAMREAARANLGLYTTFPFFQRLFRASGFTMEADQMEKNVGGPSLSDRILDATCLMGPLTRCQEQLAIFRAAGVDLP